MAKLQLKFDSKIDQKSQLKSPKWGLFISHLRWWERTPNDSTLGSESHFFLGPLLRVTLERPLKVTFQSLLSYFEDFEARGVLVSSLDHWPNAQGRESVHDHHRKKFFWRTFLASKKNFSGRVDTETADIPYKNKEARICTSEIFPLWPLFSFWGKESSSLEQGGVCIVFPRMPACVASPFSPCSIQNHPEPQICPKFVPAIVFGGSSPGH